MSTALPTTTTLNEIETCLKSGRFLSALPIIEQHTPVRTWQGMRGRALAGRLSSALGDGSTGDGLQALNHREHRKDPETFLRYCFWVYSNIGTIQTLGRIVEFLQHPQLSDSARADLLIFQAALTGDYADFTTAHRLLDQAKELSPNDAWLEVHRSTLLQEEDRIQEAIATARGAMELRPNYRPAITQLADLLYAENEDNEFIALLEDAIDTNDSWRLPQQLRSLYTEREDHDRANELLDEVERRAVWANARLRKWISARRADSCFLKGDVEGLRKHAKASDTGYFKKLAERAGDHLRENQRVRLDVGFVRQDRMTCAPATLAAIGRFWNKDTAHLEVADDICYDGTPSHSQRKWALENGWVVREFRAEWDVTVALLDRGVPFALTTVEATSSHLQAVIGYDPRVRSLLIRDPGQRHYSEWFIEALTEDYRANGPRGMVMVPEEKAELLEGIEFPDQELYELGHNQQIALEDHDREEAEAIWQTMLAQAPEHRLTLVAEGALARYDDNPTRLFSIYEKLLKMYPEDGFHQLQYYYQLRTVRGFSDQLDHLRERISGDKIATVFYSEMAELLRHDSRNTEEALYYIRKSLRYRSKDASLLRSYAGILWDRGDKEKATDLYRYCTCLQDKWEGPAETYFNACRFLGRTEEGLDFLRERFERYGKKSHEPGQTYCEVLDRIGEDGQALAVAEALLEQHPDKGEVQLFAVGRLARWGKREQAKALLAKAEGHCPPASWHQQMANLAESETKPEEALVHLRAAAEIQPLAQGGHSSITRLLAETEGIEAAIAYLDEICERFPRNIPLAELRIQWLRNEDDEAWEIRLRELLEIDPTNTWGRRELVLALSAQHKWDEATAEAEIAKQADPRSTWTYSVIGRLHLSRGAKEQAYTSFKRAVELSVDNSSAIEGLIESCESGKARREALAFVEKQIIEQVVLGEALTCYADTAYPILEPAELLASLEKAHSARPDLWETWNALIHQHRKMGANDLAIEKARAMTERFPLIPRAWHDLALAHRSADDLDGEIEALQKALEINPQWAYALRSLGEAQEAKDDLAAAGETYAQAIKVDPLAASSRGCLANVKWKLGEREEALQLIREGVELDPDYTWGWERLGNWGMLIGQEEISLEVARSLVEKRGGKGQSWEKLAGLLEDYERHKEALETYEKGIEVDPRNTTLHDGKVRNLVWLRRWEEARAACSPDEFEGAAPRNLRARLGWLERAAGNAEKSFEITEKLVEEHPDFYWPRQNLTNWYFDDERPEEALESAVKLARLAPSSPAPLGHAGRICLSMGKKDEAIGYLQKAFAIDPDYGFAALELIDHHLDKRELEPAEAILSRYAMHHTGNATLERYVRLACVKKDKQAALQHYAALCAEESSESYSITQADEAMKKAGFAKDRDQAREEAIKQGAVGNRHVAAAWVRQRLEHRTGWKVSNEIPALSLSTDATCEAWEQVIYGLMEQNKHRKVLEIIRSHPQHIEPHTEAWAAAAYALNEQEIGQEALRWIGDWKARDELRLWMVSNIADILHRTRGMQAGMDAREYALEQLPPDHMAQQMRGILAAGKAAAGNSEQAKLLLKQYDLDPAEAPPVTQFSAHLARGLVGEVTPADAIGKARVSLKEWQNYPLLKDLMDAATPRLKAIDNGWKTRWQLLRCKFGGGDSSGQRSTGWSVFAWGVGIYIVLRLIALLGT